MLSLILEEARRKMSRLLQCARSTTLCRSAQVLRASPQNRKYASVDDAQEEEPGGQPPVCIIGAGIAGCSVGHVLRYASKRPTSAEDMRRLGPGIVLSAYILDL